MTDNNAQESFNIGIVGRGLVGTKVGELLIERDFPLAGSPRIFATERSAGTVVELGGEPITIELAASANYEDLDLLFNTAPAGFSRQNAEAIHEQGPVVIDSSSDWRQDPRVPLLIPEVNPGALDEIEIGIIAKSNCTTTIGALVLHYLHAEAGLKSISASTYQSVSGQGEAGIESHRAQVRAMSGRVDELVDGQVDPYSASTVFPAITAFNVAAVAGKFEDGYGTTTEESKFRNEMRKIFKLSPEELPIDVTCVRTGTYNCHALSILAEFEDEIDTERASEILSASAGIELHEQDDVPQPIFVAGTEPVHVGRLRQSERHGKKGLNFWVVGDNLLKGAALNAVQIAELIIKT